MLVRLYDSLHEISLEYGTFLKTERIVCVFDMTEVRGCQRDVADAAERLGARHGGLTSSESRSRGDGAKRTLARARQA